MEEILEEKYTFCKELGSGGSGKVYKVYDKHLQCEMAVKEFPAEDVISLKELDMLKELRHPALPVITDYLESGGYRYLVMEYIEGKNLAEYIKEKGCVEQEQAVKWTLELIDVMIYLHERERPVIYRDMKPANIMIDNRGKIRLVDFGTAYLRYDGEENDAGAGTYGYAAPEQFKGYSMDTVDERSDIYGVGATLFHMLTGSNPSMPPYMMQPIRIYNKGLSVELEKIVKKATEEEKSKRYQTVRQLKEALEKYRSADRVRSIICRGTESSYYMILAGLGMYFLRMCARVETAIGKDVIEKTLAEEEVLKAAVLIFLLCLMKMAVDVFKGIKGNGMKQEKNILLTAKKGRGLMIVLFAGAMIVFFISGNHVSAQEEKVLLVNVRNEKGQKILIRYDAVYSPEDTFKLELPLSNFAAGNQYELKLECTNCETKEKSSRTFYLKGLEP